MIWTTTNHKNDAHRFRVAFPLSRYVARDEMAQLWAGVHAFFKEWGDVRTKDPARMMIGPAQWQATDAQFIRVDDFGQMDVAHVLAMAPVPTSIAVSARPKHRAPATHSSVVSVERKKAQLALDNWNQGTLTHEHLRGVKAEHLLPAAIQVSNHRRYGSKLTAAKKTLVKMQQAAK